MGIKHDNQDHRAVILRILLPMLRQRLWRKLN